MTRAIALALTMLAGALLGAAGIDKLDAHGKPLRAYAVIEIDEVMDQRVLHDILVKTSSVAERFGGRTITQAGSITGRDMVPPNDDAQAWSTSSAEAELDQARDRAAKTRSFLVDDLRK